MPKFSEEFETDEPSFPLVKKTFALEKTSSPDSNWYLIHTKARLESVALENLQRQSYEFFPLNFY
jgi:hypothetical protein